METRSRKSQTSGTLSGRGMLTSLAVHVPVVLILILLPAQALLKSAPPKKEIDIVFYRPPEVKLPPRTAAMPLPKATIAVAAGAPAGAPAPALKPNPNARPGPDGIGRPE